MIQTAKDILTDLMKFYDKRLSPAQIIFYEDFMDDFDDDSLCRAVMNLKQQEPINRFPTPAVIRKYFLEERDVEWQKRKRSEPRTENLVHLSANTGGGYENFKKVFMGIGKIPKSEWLRLGVTSGMLTEIDCMKLKESWRNMGADEESWAHPVLF